MYLNKPIKQLFNAKGNWLNYLNKHRKTLRQAVIENVTKMLASLAAPLSLAAMKIALITNTFTKRVNPVFAAVMVLRR
ncbi:transposase [Vibrio crassostreae]|uniref:Transposase n=1 Tax=Vibrio crassostreae TaxID=246167 RepID=A0A822MSE4_9VIBR|nr:transposase [Vibrio crassostreae]CAK2173895.1 transposase [Vibrio crassostreae]CAK2292159.1 transposase [Vibrio crassostreae]CAK2382610.1 transposase [Vibrio crassostreae]CAK2382691.1 transposase [Vibrio crassostreae]